MTELSNLLERLAKHKNDLELEAKKALSGISVERFSSAPKPLDMVAVDGSYSFILNFSQLWLVVIRAVGVRYSLKKRYILREATPKEEWVLVTKDKDIAEELPYGGVLKKLCARNAREMAKELMRRREHELISHMAKKVNHCVVALDGALKQPTTWGFMEEAIAWCKKNENLLVGLSKESTIRKWGTRLRDEDLLSQIPRAPWYAKTPMYNQDGSEVYGNTYFAKLFTQSKPFRADTPNPPEDVFPQLAAYAKSIISPGYPYPLLEAHKRAVMVRKLKKIYEDKVIKAAREKNISVLEWLTTQEGERIKSFHSWLDSVCG